MTTTPSFGILVVDDDPHVAQTMELIFLARGYKVRVAYSAEEAIEIIAGWRPDLAVIDVMLPKMNGIDLGCALKENYPNAEVILLSGHPDAARLLASAGHRGFSFPMLAKPMHPVTILEIVAGLLPGAMGRA